MQYKVPQNVDIEDKVIAGLTLRQFMFLMVSGGILLLLYYLLTSVDMYFLFMPSAMLVGGLGVTLAFIKINDRPFEEFLISAAKTIITPSRRMWEKEVVSEKEIAEEPKKQEEAPKKKSLGEIRSNLQQLAMIVDSGGTHQWDDESRLTNVKVKSVQDPQKIQDILEETEKPSEKLTKFFEKAVKEVSQTKKEPTVSAVATKSAKPQDFKYENIELANEKALEEILEKTEEGLKEKEEKLENAKIVKFDHTS